MDKKKMAVETAAIAQQVSDALHKVLDPYIEKMDENAGDTVSAPQVMGLLIGFRHFVGSVSGLEVQIVDVLQNSGVTTPEKYASMVRGTNQAGILIGALCRAAIEDE